MAMTRDELVTLSDDEVLARYRRKHANPYLPLSIAKKLQTQEAKYRHLGAAAKRAQEAAEERQRQLRNLVNHAGERC